MNPTLETMHAHRSIRQYTDDPVPQTDIDAAIRAGQAAATSSAVQSYSVIQVTNPDARNTIAQLAGPQEKVAKSGAFFVFLADTRRHRLICKEHNETYQNTFENFMVAIIDATLFAQNTTLAFESMGYGTCYIGGIRNDLDRVHETLSIPEGVFALYGLCVGTKAHDPSKRPRLAPESVLMQDTYKPDDEIRSDIAKYDARYLEYLNARGTKTQSNPASWSDAMRSKHTSATRNGVAKQYASMGAPLV